MAAVRERTVENKKITDRDDYDSGLKEQVTIQEQTSDIYPHCNQEVSHIIGLPLTSCTSWAHNVDEPSGIGSSDATTC